MRLDRKLLLIAPTIVLVFVVAGVAYAARELHVLSAVSDSFNERNAFITAVEQGRKTLDQRQAMGIIRYSFDVETKRTVAIVAIRDLLTVLSLIAFAALGALAFGVRKVPREHWPRFRGDQTAEG